jgi:predicted nucleotidyltransferase
MNANESLIVSRIVALIVSQIIPEQIILFGSYARGDTRSDSDIDILIIVKNLKNERNVTGLLYKSLLKEEIAIPVDFIAVDYDKYNELKTRTGYIYKTIAHEGVVVYERGL